LSAPHLQQQVNRHGNVKIMVRVKCWAISKKIGERNAYSFTARQVKYSRNYDLMQKLLNTQQEITTHIGNSHLHESGTELDIVIQYEIGVGEHIIWRGRSYIDLPLWISVKKHV